MAIGDVQWLKAMQAGAFDKRPPVPWEPPAKARPRHVSEPKPRLEMVRFAEYHGRPCPYCALPMAIGSARYPTRDHVVPRSKGGTYGKSNIVIVCRPCNGAKGDMSLDEFAAWLTKRGDIRAKTVQYFAARRWPRDYPRIPARG